MTLNTEIDTVVGVAHPLDPLSREEISRASAILKDGPAAAESFRFISVELREPDKELLRSGAATAREADAVLVNRAEGRAYEAIVDLDSGIVSKWTKLAENVHPPFMLDEFAEGEEACRKNPEVQAALAKRGITNMDLVCFEPWSVGYFGEDNEGRRLMRALVFVRDEEDDSPYAHPIENFIVIVDLNTGEVVKLEDDQAIPVPSASGNYLPKYVGEARTDLKPISITQPEGASFTVTGNHVQWADWSFRVGFTPREGLVLHQLKFRNKGVERPVINRASLSEMVVPYGDTAPVQAKKNAFDSGEYNIGNMANSLTLGCDCTGEIKYFDGITTDSLGNPLTIENAICMHEEDDSILWKHFDFREGTAETRRSRKLVISFIATVANYEYAFYWHLFLDGSIEFLVKATGILSTAGQKPGEKSPYGQTLNNDGLYAPIHQHMFNVRMDFELDGPATPSTKWTWKSPNTTPPTPPSWPWTGSWKPNRPRSAKPTPPSTASGRSPTTRARTSWTNPSPTGSSPPTASSSPPGTSPTSPNAPSSPGTTSGSPPTTGPNGSPPANSPTRPPAPTTACTSGPKKTGTSSTRTSWSGTPSACTTSSASKTGPSCPARTSASCSNPTASSTKTPP